MGADRKASQLTLSRDQVEPAVKEAVRCVAILDMHTHVYEPRFGALLLRGIDELLTYHYLIAEVTRVTGMAPGRFYRMTKKRQAEFIWEELFLRRSPVSEAARGVLTTLLRYGLDARREGLDGMRRFFRGVTAEQHIDLVFETSGVSEVVMTNDPFNDPERKVWMKRGRRDGRFLSALRIDPLVTDLPGAARKLAAWGYDVASDLGGKSASEVRRFVADWIKRMKARYVAMSFEPDFAWPDDSLQGRILKRCVIPACRDAGVPFALMIGVRRKVHPELLDAGDGVGQGAPSAVGALCAEFPKVRFLCTMLSRVDQHELAVTARKFSNLGLFGCWWFLNNPSIVAEMTAMRIELLGLSFVPQHSDARVLDQLVYKWAHARKVIGEVLAAKYLDLYDAGWAPSRAEITRDVESLFSGLPKEWLGI